MYKKEVLEEKTRLRLWWKLRKLKQKYPELDVLEKNSSACNRTKQYFWYVVIEYDDGIPFLRYWDKSFETKYFGSKEERLAFINREGINHYWLRDWKKHCYNGHIYAVTFKKQNLKEGF